jgi:hypothetical protein
MPLPGSRVIDETSQIPIAHLGGHAHRKSLGVKQRDAPSTRLALDKAFPKLGNVYAQRADATGTCHYNAASHYAIHPADP